jgi:hypothetical protein
LGADRSSSMLTITVTSNVPAFLQGMDRRNRQIPFAMAVALSRTAKACQEREEAEIAKVFDRPIARTQRGIYTVPANRTDLVATVGVKDSFVGGIPVDRYLEAEVKGGIRRDKRSEKAIKARFTHLAGEWVPGPGVRLNVNGNVSGATIVRILADLQVQVGAGYAATRTARSLKRNKAYGVERYFVPPPGSALDKRARGVWVRRGRKVIPALIFVRSIDYRRRFDFFGVGKRTAEATYPIELERALVQAFATARD